MDVAGPERAGVLAQVVLSVEVELHNPACWRRVLRELQSVGSQLAFHGQSSATGGTARLQGGDAGNIRSGAGQRRSQVELRNVQCYRERRQCHIRPVDRSRRPFELDLATADNPGAERNRERGGWGEIPDLQVHTVESQRLLPPAGSAHREAAVGDSDQSGAEVEAVLPGWFLSGRSRWRGSAAQAGVVPAALWGLEQRHLGLVDGEPRHVQFPRDNEGPQLHPDFQRLGLKKRRATKRLIVGDGEIVCAHSAASVWTGASFRLSPVSPTPTTISTPGQV